MKKTEMDKILIYISSIAYGGGAERMVCYLANWLCQRGYEILLLNDKKEKEEYSLNSQVKRIIICENSNPNRLKKNIIQIRDIRNVCKDFKPDICVSFLPEADFRLLIAAIGLHIPTVFSVRADPKKQYSSLPYFILSKVLYPLAEGAVFQTSEAKMFFSKKIQENAVIIPNGISREFLEYPTEIEHRNIISVGRLSQSKSFDVLINAFAKIAHIYSEQNLIIYGEGSERESLEKKIKDMNLEGKIRLPGYIRDVKKELSKAKMFVLSSSHEGMPNALIEAMALSCPVISTDCPCGGPGMLIQNGENGLLVKVGDANELANALKKILNDGKLEDKLRKNSRESMKKYEISQICVLWEKYLDNIYSKYQANKNK